jgi:hypothetical protein
MLRGTPRLACRYSVSWIGRGGQRAAREHSTVNHGAEQWYTVQCGSGPVQTFTRRPIREASATPCKNSACRVLSTSLLRALACSGVCVWGRGDRACLCAVLRGWQQAERELRADCWTVQFEVTHNQILDLDIANAAALFSIPLLLLPLTQQAVVCHT